ncbi:SOS response-associated peptidase [Rhizobacter fulvus]
MCTRYVSPDAAAIERHWRIDRRNPWRGGEIFPQRPGAFLRAARDSTEFQRELVVGQWGLIPWFAKTPKLTYSTCNARSEELASKATFKQPWARAQRCIIPAASFDEPNWESGRNVWWRFRRADGALWGLAGLWNVWTDLATGEIHESYTMLTLNADAHPLMRRMHKPDPKLAPDRQDKRSVIPIAPEDTDLWLAGPPEQAAGLITLTDASEFDAGPVHPMGVPAQGELGPS